MKVKQVRRILKCYCKQVGTSPNLWDSNHDTFRAFTDSRNRRLIFNSKTWMTLNLSISYRNIQGQYLHDLLIEIIEFFGVVGTKALKQLS